GLSSQSADALRSMISIGGLFLQRGGIPRLLASTTSESWLPMDSDISQRSNCNARACLQLGD
ncbi:MAG TPA: hypothetical protein VK577_22905, partial [Bradyrhizobium sp.]|nr:hypothetical protein [Bradyrhizobium sp.]